MLSPATRATETWWRWCGLKNLIAVTAPDGAKLTGKVERVSFVGDRQRLAVSGAAPRPLMIDAPNTLSINVGDRIGLSIAPQDVRILPGEAR